MSRRNGSEIPFRVAVGGLSCENNTFSSHRTVLEDFLVLRGAQLGARYQFLRADEYSADVVWLPVMYAEGNTGGAIEGEVYDALEAEFLLRLRDLPPIDGLVLDIHGAMSVAGRQDCEERLLEGVRRAIGPTPIVAAAMDPHGNVSRRLVEQVDILTVHRLAPHEDAWQTRERAAKDVVFCLRSGKRPMIAWTSIPVLLNGEMTSTMVDPGRTVFSTIDKVCEETEILDAGIWVGFAWADEARCRAAAAVTGFDVERIRDATARLAHVYWSAREDFQVVAPSWGTATQAVQAAVAAKVSPLFISDSGDNITAGAAGDTSELLLAFLSSEEILAGKKRLLFAALLDPEAVARCVDAGEGAEVDLRTVVQLDAASAREVRGRVRLISRGLFRGEIAPSRAESTVAVVDAETITLVLTERRMTFLQREDFEGLSLDVRSFDVIVVKNGYLFPYQRNVAADWFMAITRGSTDLEPERLEYTHLDRPLFPLDKDLGEPQFAPEVFMSANREGGQYSQT